VLRFERLLVETSLLRYPWLPRFHDEISLKSKIARFFESRLRSQIDSDTPLGCAEVSKKSTILCSILSDRAGHRPPAKRITTRWFNLDDIGASIDQQLGAVRPRKSVREVDDTQTSEW
jgi:hypothetical protein